MGYTTQFKGELKFKSELVGSQLAYLNSILDEDCREHPEWNTSMLSYVDLKLTDDFSGLRWSGAEKTYYMVELVNLVIRLMRSKWLDFELSGMFVAQGEDIEDRWQLVIVDGLAVQQEVAIVGQKITCPHCDTDFILEEK